MNEKQPEPIITFKIYQNGEVTIGYKGKEVTVPINSPEMATVATALTLGHVAHRTAEWVEKTLETIFEKKEEKKDEPGKA